VRLLLTHGGESDARIKEGLKPQGIDCTTIETTGKVYDLDESIDAGVGLVYPSRLPEGGVIDALGNLFWVNGPREVLTTRNKARTTALLDRADIPTPETRLVSDPVNDDSVSRAFEEVGSPAVLKPNSASAGRGAILIHGTDSATGVGDLFGVVHESSLVEDRTYLIQEFIKQARDYRLMILDGEYAGAVERRSDGWKKNVHAGAEPVGVEPPDVVVSVAKKAARVLGVPFCGVDVLYTDTEDGVRTLINEVNARPTVDNAEKYQDGFYSNLARLVEECSQKETD